MAIVNSRASNSGNKFRRQSKKNLIPVRVIDIILDNTHPRFEEFGQFDSIGSIIYTAVDKNITKENINNPNIARPLFSYIKHYPLINEIVLILTTTDKTIYGSGFNTTYYLPNINIWNHPHHNALPSINDLKVNEGDQQADYEEIESGIVRRPKDGGTDIKLGDYFLEKNKLKPLLPFEGDHIIEGRFGNSIRFGSTTKQGINDWSFSDPELVGSPITIIRNGQSQVVDDISWMHTVENINTDASSIYLTSNQSISNFKTAGLPTSDDLTISWPSFGQNQPEVTRTVEITEETNLTNLTTEEVQEIIEGEEEISELVEEKGDITIIEKLPENEEEEGNEEIIKYVNSVFGKYVKLPLLAGVERLFMVGNTGDDELLQQADGEFRKVYYPLKIESASPTSEITAQKLIEIMSYYKIKPSPGKPAFYAGISKKSMNLNIANEYFRPHYLPGANSIHISSYQGYMNLYKDAVANEFVTEEELDFRIRVQILDDIWAEIAHSADIEKNGIFGYIKDDVKGTTGDWFKKLFTGQIRRKGINQPEAIFIPDNYDLLNPDDRSFTVRVNGVPATPGDGSFSLSEGDINVQLDFVNVPGKPGNTSTFFVKANPFGSNEGPNKIFKSNSYLNTENIKLIKKSAEAILVNELDNPITLRYVDLSLVSDSTYDNLAHYEGRTHQIIEPQLESIWLTDYNADDELTQSNNLEARSENKTEAEEKYISLSQNAGKSNTPNKYYNQATGEYILTEQEIILPEGDTIDGEGRSIDQATSQKKARRDAEQKASQLGARVGSLVKAIPSRIGEEYIYRATYILLKPE